MKSLSIHVLRAGQSSHRLDSWEDVRGSLASGELRLEDCWWGEDQVVLSRSENYRWIRFDEMCPGSSDGITPADDASIPLGLDLKFQGSASDNAALRRAFYLINAALGVGGRFFPSERLAGLRSAASRELGSEVANLLDSNLKAVANIGFTLSIDAKERTEILRAAIRRFGRAPSICKDRLSISRYARLEHEPEFALSMTSVVIDAYLERQRQMEEHLRRNPVRISPRRLRRAPYVLRPPSSINPYAGLNDANPPPPPVPGSAEFVTFEHKKAMLERWTEKQNSLVAGLEASCDPGQLFALHARIDKDGQVTSTTWLSKYSLKQKILFAIALFYVGWVLLFLAFGGPPAR